MEPKETTKITINGQVYARIEDVPEKYRALIQAQMKLALERAAAGLPAANISVRKEIHLGSSSSDADPSVSVSRPGANLLATFVSLALFAFLLYMMFSHWR